MLYQISQKYIYIFTLNNQPKCKIKKNIKMLIYLQNVMVEFKEVDAI